MPRSRLKLAEVVRHGDDAGGEQRLLVELAAAAQPLPAMFEAVQAGDQPSDSTVTSIGAPSTLLSFGRAWPAVRA